jgi:hypothetical protein
MYRLSISIPKEGLAKFSRLVLPKNIVIGDNAPYAKALAILPEFNVVNFRIVDEIIHNPTQNGILVSTDGCRTLSFRGERKCEIIGERELDNSGSGSVAYVFGRSISSIDKHGLTFKFPTLWPFLKSSTTNDDAQIRPHLLIDGRDARHSCLGTETHIFGDLFHRRGQSGSFSDGFLHGFGLLEGSFKITFNVFRYFFCSGGWRSLKTSWVAYAFGF